VRTFLIVVGVTIAVWAVAIAVLYVMGRRMVALKLARAIPDVLALFRGLLADPRTPLGSKIVVGLGFLYLLNPIDLIPEFVPVIGPFDDVIVMALVLRHLVKRAGRQTVVEHWRGEPATLVTVLRLAGLRGGPAQGTRLASSG
jgi:uncharacterized membrane protein YkvA (DUF1232 family)